MKTDRYIAPRTGVPTTCRWSFRRIGRHVRVEGKPGTLHTIMSENETTTAEETAVTPLARFEVPSRLEKIEDPNDANHLTFVAEPFENGYGHTLGNSLRRVLLGSLEGAAITSVRIAGAQHEFSSLPGVVEDVTEIYKAQYSELGLTSVRRVCIGSLSR